MRPQRVTSFSELRQFFMDLPPHNGDPRVAESNLALLRAARQQIIDEPRVPYELTESDRVFLKGIRVSA